MIHPFLQQKLEAVKSVCRKHDVIRIYAFGSVCTDHFTDQSDVDFLLSFGSNTSIEDFADNYFNLTDELEKILKRKVDLVTERTLKNPYFIKQVNQTKLPIYE